MAQQLSRRELIAWLAAGTGAAAAGVAVLGENGGGNDDDPLATATLDSTSTTPNVRPDPATPGSMRPTPQIAGDRLLVVVEMPGGNDGLSTAVPYGLGRYYDVRESTAIAPGEVLAIDDTVGLHPNLAGLHARGVTLVHGVGSSTPDGSHFEMLNRWWSGDSNAADMSTGWVGRLADVLRGGGDGDVPAAALSVGSGDHPIIRSRTGATLSLPGVDALWAMVGADPDDEFLTAYQAALRSFAEPDGGVGGRYRETMAATLGFADRVLGDGVAQDEDELDADDPGAAGYSWSALGLGLWLAARLFTADTGVRVVHVTMDGDFDTHEGHAWRHPELMTDLDSSLTAFHTDLDQRGLADRVLVATTSEFGRTLHENGSSGLDHGTASTMLLSGPVASAQIGDVPSLTTLDDNDDMIATVPLEAYLGGLVEGWLGVPASEVFAGSEPLALNV